DGERAGRGDHTALGRGIGELTEPAEPGAGGDVDDAAAAAGNHRAGGGPRAVRDAGEVDGDDALPDLVRELAHPAVDVDPGVVDEHVDRAEPALGLGEQIVDLGAGRDVDRYRDRLVTALLQFRNDVVSGLIRQVGDRDAGALSGELACDGTADALGRAGDDRGAPFEGTRGHGAPFRPTCSTTGRRRRRRTTAGR